MKFKLRESLNITPLQKSDYEEFNNASQLVFHDVVTNPLTLKSTYKIYDDDTLIGYIGLSKYKDGLLGIGNFMILPQHRRKQYATKVIQKIIDDYKKDYWWIYCFVDKQNTAAIALYTNTGVVEYDKENSKGQYRVTFYKDETRDPNED